MKILKTTMKIVVILLFAFIAFFFYGSSSSIMEEEYFILKTYREPAVPKDSLTVMTYNIGYMSGMTNNLSITRSEDQFLDNLNNAKKILELVNPDLIGFQEIDYASSRSFYHQQLDSLSVANDYHMAYQSVNWDKQYVPFPYWPPKNQFGRILSGQALLSKYTLSNAETIVLEAPEDQPFYYTPFYIDRVIQVSDMTIGSRTIKVMNLHLEAYNEKTRLKQAEVVGEMMSKWVDVMPVIVFGDFNGQPSWEEDDFRTMDIVMKTSGLTSAIQEKDYKANPEEYYTFDSRDPYQMIDFILYNEQFISKIESRVVSEAGEISDHLPLMLKFTFNN